MNLIAEMKRSQRRATSFARNIKKANPLGSGEALLLGVLGVGVVGGVIYFATRPKTAAPAASSSTPTPATAAGKWVRVTSIPPGASFAVTAPAASMPAATLSQYQTAMTAAGFTVYPVGGGPPLGWPEGDPNGTNAIRFSGINGTGAAMPVTGAMIAWTWQ